MPLSLVHFYEKTQSQYNAIQVKDPNSLYFISDNKRLYKGSELYFGREHFQGVMASATDEVWFVSGYKAGDFAYVSEHCQKSIGGQTINLPAQSVLLCISDFNSAASASDFVVLQHNSAGGNVSAASDLASGALILGQGHKDVATLPNPQNENLILAFTSKGIEWVTPLASQTPQNLVIKLNSGTTEGTDMFTFNGSIAKTVDIQTGPVWE